MFASQPKVVEFSDGGSVTIRKLSWRSLEKAREAKGITQASSLRQFGGEVVKVLRSEALDEAAKKLAESRANPEERRKARYAEFDRGSLLVAGITAWTYGELNPESIYEMPEDMAERLHQEICDLSLPPLDPVEAEAVGKGNSAASTSS